MLPNISAPSFSTKLPSTGREIKYRPFLVKEEKVLLMALEGGDSKEIMNAVLKVVSSCVESEIDADQITTFDLEYLFLKLRGKSVGEVVDLTLRHEEETDCVARTKVGLNLDEIEVMGTISDGKIMITDEVGVKMRYPNLNDMDKIQSAVADNEVDSTFDVIAMCVEYIFDKENVYNDFTQKELQEWLETLSQKQFENISSFFSNVPKLAHDLHWTCSKCGKSETVHLEGLESFFTLG